MELRDRTGAIGARVFRDADLLAGRFDRGDLVRVAAASSASATSSSSRWRRSRAPGDADPAAFLPVAYRDLDELDGFLEHLAGEVRDGQSRPARRLLADRELRAALRRSPCTRDGHHAYLGGLLEHTVAVATLAVETCALHPRLDQDLLLTAAIVHDLGRTREFTLGAEIGLTDEGRMLGASRSAPGWSTTRAGSRRPRTTRAGWRSRTASSPTTATAARPRRRRSPAALNALDAAVKGALEHGLASGAGPG